MEKHGASTSRQAPTSVEASTEQWDDSQLSKEQEDEQPPHHNKHDEIPTEGAETAGSSSPCTTFTLPSDPALWGPLTETLREEAIHRGPAAFHNRASSHPPVLYNECCASLPKGDHERLARLLRSYSDVFSMGPTGLVQHDILTTPGPPV
ncbi:unnamed protein product [Gadus morhua 'NCC']